MENWLLVGENPETLENKTLKNVTVKVLGDIEKQTFSLVSFSLQYTRKVLNDKKK